MPCIALIGHPNCGKSTLFNALTGGALQVGNWPGVTVACHRGEMAHQGVAYQVIDLPGLYSLNETIQAATDATIARHFILEHAIDVVVNIVDASHLAQQLYLTLQLRKMGIPVIVALNMMDVAKDQHIQINLEALSRELDCPVVPMSARKGRGVARLKETISRVMARSMPCDEATHANDASETGLLRPKNGLAMTSPAATRSQQHVIARSPEEATCSQQHVIARSPEGTTWQSTHTQHLDRRVALRAPRDDEFRNDAPRDDEFHNDELAMVPVCPETLYHHIDAILAACINTPAAAPTTLTDRIDHFALSRIWGLPIFFAVMYAMFACGIGLGSYFQTYFDRFSEFIFVDQCTQWLGAWHAPAWCITLFANGLGRGLNTIITFVPVLASFFLFLSYLEDSGYMMRAVFLVDRFMRRLGLPGQAFVPMIIGFGCNVPAVMAARALPHHRDRLLTILMTPFMSCSARLTIYAIFAALFFPHHPASVVFALYFIGIIAALGTGFFLRKTVLKGTLAPLVMALPAYHRPHFKTLLSHAMHRLTGFIYRAGKVIVPVCIVMALLNTYSFDGGLAETAGQSILSRVGQTITPLFAPMGLHADNWPATVGLMTGVLAKEVVIGTLNTLYAPLGDTGAAISHLFGGPIEAFAYLLFVLLYFPCVSTMAVMLREMHRGWAIFSMGWMLLVAYGLATLFYQLGTIVQHPLSSLAWCAGIVGVFALIFMAMRWLSNQKVWLDQADKSHCATSLCQQGGGCLQCPLRRVY